LNTTIQQQQWVLPVRALRAPVFLKLIITILNEALRDLPHALAALLLFS
jgi:hypothetical protein